MRLLSKFELPSLFNSSPVESFVGETVVKELDVLRVKTINIGTYNIHKNVTKNIPINPPAKNIESVKMASTNPELAPQPTLDSTPNQQLNDEEQKRANLQAAYDEIDGTTQQDTQSILRG